MARPSSPSTQRQSPNPDPDASPTKYAAAVHLARTLIAGASSKAVKSMKTRRSALSLGAIFTNRGALPDPTRSVASSGSRCSLALQPSSSRFGSQNPKLNAIPSRMAPQICTFSTHKLKSLAFFPLDCGAASLEVRLSRHCLLESNYSTDLLGFQSCWPTTECSLGFSAISPS